MKMKSIRVAVMAAGVLPVMAIEPPVDSAPIPPQEPAKEAPAPADRAAKAPAAQAPAPMPDAVAVAERPYIGVILDPLPEMLVEHLQLKKGEGVMISELIAGGPAEEAGLEVNDLLVEVDGEKVGSRDEVRGLVEKHGVGDELVLGIIHHGERKEVTVTLGAAPKGMPGVQGAPGAGFLDGIPDKHADAIREALEQNLRQFEELELEQNDAGEMQKKLMQRMQRQMGGMQLKLGGLEGGMQLKLGGLDGGIEAESSIRLLDDEGSIEMKQSNGAKEASVFGKDGKLLWEGPYDTEQDKAAVPEDIRERIERLNFDIGGIDGNGMRLEINPGRFRPLDEIEPDVDEAPVEED